MQLRRVEDARERAALLREINRVGCRTEDRHARVGEAVGEPEGRLTAELHDDADELAGLRFCMDDLEHIFERERLEVQAIGGVVVGRDRLGVAVDHDRLEAGVPQGEARVHAAVVELDALADAVGARAENDDLARLTGHHLGLEVVARVVIWREGGKLAAARVDRLEHRAETRLMALRAHGSLGRAAQGGQLHIAEAVVFRVSQEALRSGREPQRSRRRSR